MLEIFDDKVFRAKLRKLNGRFFIILVFTFFLILVYLYRYYSFSIEREKNQILQNQYTKIVQIIDKKLSKLAVELNQNIHDRNILIKINDNHIEICTNTNHCIKYSIFRFGSLLSRHVPEYLYYKIDINNKFIYTNTKFSNVSFKKAYHINHNSQFNISLAINPDYLLDIENSIKRPLWILIIFMILVLATSTLINNVLSKKLNRLYNKFYNEKYTRDLELTKLSYQQEIKNNIGILKKTIWENDFKYQKDLEINNILAKKVQEISLINNLSEIIKEDHLTGSKCIPDFNTSPCSLVVYQDDKIEKDISTDRLIEIFTGRFKEESNVAVSITSEIPEVCFASTAALYQIIYSLLKYLIFILDKRLEGKKQIIRLRINNINDMASLQFEYDGVQHESIGDFLKRENYFFRTHSNPFILNPSQIFKTLEIDRFEATISCVDCNILQIKQFRKHQNNKLDLDKSNIISLTSFKKKNT